ncbi:nucleotidyltransferase family protein [Bartonella sp. LJL80]
MIERPDIQKAMVLAAGLGTRMRPLTLKTPKPLVKIAGRTLLDRTLDQLQKAGIDEAVVNVHHLGSQIEDYLEARKSPHIIISNERAELLDSAGGVVKALPHLGSHPFFILNADTFWVDHGAATLAAMARHFDDDKMDMLLLTVRRDQAAGPERGDFLVGEDGKLSRAPENMQEAVIYGGAILVRPAIFAAAPVTPHSLNHYFDQSIEKGRLFGFPLEGNWYTVGTVDMIATVEELLEKRGEGA